MLSNIKELYSLLTRQQRKRLLRLQLLVVAMAFAEVAGVMSIGPFMALVGDLSYLQGNGMLASLYRMTGMNQENFLFWLGNGVLLALTLAAGISMFTVWRLSLYGHQVGAELSMRLYRRYMQQPWLFHASGSSSELTNKIAQECNRVTESILAPLMQMNAKLVMATFMVITVFSFNPLVALAGVTIFVLAYLVLYRVVRRKLVANGRIVTLAQAERFNLMQEGFGGIKDVLLLGRQKVFNDRFEKASRRYGQAQGTTKALAMAPRYAMELVAFGAVIFLVLFLLKAHSGNLTAILPLVSVYALASFKLLPAFQQIYTSISTIRGNLSAFDAIRDDLHASQEGRQGENGLSPATGVISPQESIALADVHFRYPGKEGKVLDGLSLSIPAKQVIGLVGPSGSGKSTVIDMLLGLIQPDGGELLIDGQPLTLPATRAWQNNLGLVPQAIFLADASIRENIAFGLPPEEIDEARIKRAARMAQLDEFLQHLPRGLETRVGERGIQLSGGQRQRIGIARALYDDAEVLVLDEATSSLDGITEKRVMDTIHEFSSSKTIIIIAHRLATVKQCDCIYLIKQGRVADQGSYDDLVERNPLFKHMTEHA
ncbi:ABC transporter ATP-binding protein [Halomonas marinisediminis]|uniref:ABC transporter ATP-binding protein n=2 Tax=Halomonas marinisediminis TaxID=2546095 RepID=A0ABY2D6A5_9GAMM|nr:ABC transporter ATP-binding protein [Halomonas marinisediminis]